MNHRTVHDDGALMVSTYSPHSTGQNTPQGLPRAAVVRAALRVDVDHADLGVPPAVRRGFAALDIERRKRHTRVV